MKKTILASAIAAATFSGAALAQESNLPTVYGNIQLAVVHDNYDGGPSTIEHADNGSTIGLTHDHEIAPGVTGFFKAELEFDADDKAGNGGLNAFDEAYIGVKGDQFGTVWVGSDDSTYESAIDKIANFFEVASLNLGGLYETGEGDLIQYSSPSFSGLQLHGAVQVNGDGDKKAGKKSYPFQLAATYTVDALELAFAVDSNDGGRVYSKFAGQTDDNGVVIGNSSNNENTYGLRATYALDAMSVTAQYQTRKDVADIAGIMGVYTLGKNQFALAYERASYDADQTASVPGEQDAQDTVTLQALHNLSSNMYVYVEGYIGGGDRVYGFTNNSGTTATDERTVAAVGATYYF